MQTSAFRYISQFDTAKQRNKMTTVLILWSYGNTNSGIYGKRGASIHA